MLALRTPLIHPSQLPTTHHGQSTQLHLHPSTTFPTHLPLPSSNLRPIALNGPPHTARLSTIYFASHPLNITLNHTMNPSSSYFSNPEPTLKPMSLRMNSLAHFMTHNPYYWRTHLPTTRYRFSSKPPPAMKTLAAGFSSPCIII